MLELNKVRSQNCCTVEWDWPVLAMSRKEHMSWAAIAAVTNAGKSVMY